MSTDGYTLAIPENELYHAASCVAGGCRQRSEQQQRACAANIVRHQVCVCVLSCPSILKALEDDLCNRINSLSA